MKIHSRPLPARSAPSKPRPSDKQLAQDLVKQGDVTANADMSKLVNEYRASLAGEAPKGYHSYAEMTEALNSLAERFPDQAQVVVLGQSAEGRDILALRVGTQDPENPKPGIVITGCHHAREWMSVEVPLHTATTLLENYQSDPASQRRVDNTVTWFVPLVNPDGYEYSRTKDSWWRKTRRPITETGCSNLRGSTGVDPNRNYWDGSPNISRCIVPTGTHPALLEMILGVVRPATILAPTPTGARRVGPNRRSRPCSTWS